MDRDGCRGVCVGGGVIERRMQVLKHLRALCLSAAVKCATPCHGIKK